MAAGTFTLYDSVAELIADGSLDLDTHQFSMILLDSGYTPNAAHDEYADVSGDELATAAGYTAGGQVLQNVTWGQVSGVASFDSDPVVWNASGGPITARYAVIKDDDATNDKLIGYVLLDDAPADVSATDGNSLTITPHANGWFQTEVNPA